MGYERISRKLPRTEGQIHIRGKRRKKILLWETVIMFSLKTRLVGLNQILSTYMPIFSIEANVFMRNEFGI